jgi:hypothetical protein
MDMETSRELLMMLEEGRATAALAKLPRRVLTGPILYLMIALRLYIFLAIPVVAYAFIHAMNVK